MANIVITSTSNTIKVDFGDYYPGAIEHQKGVWKKDKIVNMVLDGSVEITILQEKTWLVSHDGNNGTFQIDSIDGIAPTSLDDLYNKLIALIE